MKTKVLKLRFLLSSLTLTIIMCLFFFSCQKEETVPINEPFDYEQIGIEHNKGLDYVFEYLKEKGVGKKIGLKSTTNISQLIDNATVAFLEEEANFDEKSNAISIFKAENEKGYLKSAQVNFQKDLELKLLDKTSKDKLEAIYDMLNNVRKIGIDKSVEKLLVIQSEIQSECIEQELPVLMSICVTARYSLIYWESNFEKWMLELGGIETLLLKNVRLKSGNTERDWDWFLDTVGDMAEADAYGAGAGALVGTAGVVFGPAALVTIPASAVAYGLNMSAGKGIWELFH